MHDFESPEWCQKRYSLLVGWVGDPQAVQFILDLGDAAELWDDLEDQDKPIDKAQVSRVFTNLLVELPLNPFFERYKMQLIPLMVAGINAWQDATMLEKGSDNDRAMAYVLRDWYVELTAFVVYLVRGREAMRACSMDIRRFFSAHETLHQYMENLK